MIPVVNTFIHFSRRGILARCRSAPAEVWVDLVVARARERQRLLEKRRTKRTTKIAQKWEDMLRKAWTQHEQLLMESVRDLVADQLLRTTPRLRERFETSFLFREFARVLLRNTKQKTLLWQMGVLRQRADDVKF